MKSLKQHLNEAINITGAGIKKGSLQSLVKNFTDSPHLSYEENAEDLLNYYFYRTDKKISEKELVKFLINNKDEKVKVTKINDTHPDDFNFRELQFTVKNAKFSLAFTEEFKF